MNLITSSKDNELESAIKQIASSMTTGLTTTSKGSEYQIYIFQAKNKRKYDVKSLLFKD